MSGAIKTSLRLLDNAFTKEAESFNDSSGSTVALAVLADGKLMVGNIGDSQVHAELCKSFPVLSKLHARKHQSHP